MIAKDSKEKYPYINHAVRVIGGYRITQGMKPDGSWWIIKLENLEEYLKRVEDYYDTEND